MGQRQHTVPQTYLRGFADPKGRLRAFDRIKQQRHTVAAANAAVVRDIYTVPRNLEGLSPDAIEKWIAEREALVAGALVEIRSGRSGVRQEDLLPLAEYVALQLMRTSRFWEEVHHLCDWYGKVWFEGISKEGVEEHYRKAGIEPTDEQIEEVLDFARNLDKYRFVPPEGTFLYMFLGGFLQILPFLTEGWNWVVVSSTRPFLTSDHPVVLIGDSIEGGLGVANAQEIWLPVGRHRAIVLTKNHSLPPALLNVQPVHIKRVCQRVALESNRWLYWHPRDNAIDGLATPPPGDKLIIETIGWRERGDGTIGELVNFRPNRPVIQGECLLDGRPVVNYRRELAPPWQPGEAPVPSRAS